MLTLPINPRLRTHDRKIVEEYINDSFIFKKPIVRILHELIKALRSIWKYINNISVPIIMMHSDDKVAPPRAA
ncbi:serine aminopeptidase domain-containing protein [Caldivirga sp. UBA161]|uniref:serine aminopeptidase domain-containing protein n=1 Tax=Caldivirga sp. UBA161 TaxID=1915569 RepID=UPI0025C3113D|nr:alpha/beta hydrolase [Caldivirga sp. UBA161]